MRCRQETFAIRLGCVLSLIGLGGCDYICTVIVCEYATAVTHGMVDGKVIGRGREGAYMIDLDTIVGPESDSALFVGAVGPSHDQRREWVIEADCTARSFVRGIGVAPFFEWPEQFRLAAIDYACSRQGFTGEPYFALARLSKTDRQDFLYSPEGGEPVADCSRSTPLMGEAASEC